MQAAMKKIMKIHQARDLARCQQMQTPSLVAAHELGGGVVHCHDVRDGVAVVGPPVVGVDDHEAAALVQLVRWRWPGLASTGL